VNELPLLQKGSASVSLAVSRILRDTSSIVAALSKRHLLLRLASLKGRAMRPWWHMDGPGFEWDWLKEWCAHGHGTLAREYGLWSSTPWNYAHPYWDNWSDIEWYRTVNRAFLG
jgi:hypothetical protein